MIDPEVMEIYMDNISFPEIKDNQMEWIQELKRKVMKHAKS